MSQFFFQLVLWLTRIRPVHSGHPPIPTWWYYENIFNDAVIALTHNYSTPAIMKKYVNVSAFSNLCSCKGTDGIFDDIDVVHFPNETTSAKHWVFQGLFPRQLTAGARYWDEHVCKNESTYTFYQKEPLQKQYPHLDEQMLDWFDKLESILQLLPKIHDPQFGAEPWLRELYLGYAPKAFQGPVHSGAPTHQADVQNYHVQICGSKRWIIGKESVKFNDERDIPFGGQFFTGDRVPGFVNRNDVYVGWTNPGDILLNPVWLWTMVQTNEGNNLAVAYKMIGGKIRQIAPKHIRPSLPRDKLFLGKVRHWLLFVRGRISRLWDKQPVAIVLFVYFAGTVGAAALLLRRHQKTS